MRHSQQPTRGGFHRWAHHIHLRGEAGRQVGVAHRCQRLRHGGVGGQNDRLGVHHAAGGAVVVDEQAAQIFGLVRLGGLGRVKHTL